MISEIDVRRALALKQYQGSLSFECEADGTLLDIPLVSFSSPVRVELGYEILNEDGKTEVCGSVTFSLKGQCSRCLEEAERPYVGELYAVFEEGVGDGETYGYRNVIKLDEAVRDAVVFALPSTFLCSDACQIPDYD